MQLIDESAARDGVAPTCAALGVARATFYRHKRPRPVVMPRPTPPRALSFEERERVLAVLHEEQHMDLAPAAVYAKVLDERREYLCSVWTIYRILAAAGEVHERRAQLVHPEYKKPELLATGPNQVWSWDITKLLGPVKWTYFYLYVVAQSNPGASGWTRHSFAAGVLGWVG